MSGSWLDCCMRELWEVLPKPGYLWNRAVRRLLVEGLNTELTMKNSRRLQFNHQKLSTRLNCRTLRASCHTVPRKPETLSASIHKILRLQYYVCLLQLYTILQPSLNQKQSKARDITCWLRQWSRTRAGVGVANKCCQFECCSNRG